MGVLFGTNKCRNNSIEGKQSRQIATVVRGLFGFFMFTFILLLFFWHVIAYDKCKQLCSGNRSVCNGSFVYGSHIS